METISKKIEELNELLEYKQNSNSIVFINYVLKILSNYFGNEDVRLTTKHNIIQVFIYGVKALSLKFSRKQIEEHFSVVKLEIYKIYLLNENSAINEIRLYTKNIANKKKIQQDNEIEDFFKLGASFNLSKENTIFLAKQYEKLSYLARDSIKNYNNNKEVK